VSLDSDNTHLKLNEGKAPETLLSSRSAIDIKVKKRQRQAKNICIFHLTWPKDFVSEILKFCDRCKANVWKMGKQLTGNNDINF
jgi:hypothetical protein